MNKTGMLTAKSFFRMAEYDRRLLTVTRVVSTVLTVSLILKLAVSAVLLLNSVKEK